jgi:hypothetical protein
MNWKGCGRKRSWYNLISYPGICLEGLRQTTKDLSQDSPSPCPDLNLEPLECEAGVLTILPRRLVSHCGIHLCSRGTQVESQPCYLPSWGFSFFLLSTPPPYRFLHSKHISISFKFRTWKSIGSVMSNVTTMCELWDLRFSRRWVWRLSSGMLRHEVSQKMSDVSEVLAASITRAMMETASTSETSANFYETTVRIIQELCIHYYNSCYGNAVKGYSALLYIIIWYCLLLWVHVIYELF